MATLAAAVYVTDEDGRSVVLVPGVEVPEWAVGQITNPAAWADDPEPEPEPDPEAEASPEPEPESDPDAEPQAEALPESDPETKPKRAGRTRRQA